MVVTLVIGVVGRDSIWMVADRRLSYPKTAKRLPKEDGRKMMILETTDGVAFLGYAGLGSTSLGTEPADWMCKVLLGRNFPLEYSIGIIARAMQEQLPRHLVRIAGQGRAAHFVIIPALVGTEPRFYSIDLVFAPDRKTYKFRYRRLRHTNAPMSAPHPPRVGVGGTGAFYLPTNRDWVRELLRLVKAHDHRKVSARVVADHLARLSYEIHQTVCAKNDESVGPDSIVAWRFSKDGVHGGGGGHQFYSGPERAASSGFMPSITRGADINALVQAMMPFTEKSLKALMAGEPAPEENPDEINAALARLPRTPDEKLS
ncbi:hypothetical protein AAFN88_17780 [Pelagibius sp. CAU 1746]|uniref:hypothetical protein n=1 Tax=Pelagibius sp. CAU 1746 TaxID=3140370 RepID=UPI00325A4B36